jgi:alpha-tubulin suppressor-like RCC1 family protein
MNWLLLVLALAGACKRKEVPFVPPAPEDAGSRSDAAPEIDAPAAREAPKAQKIVVSDHFSCALLSDASVRCWGRNSEGQIGNGTTADVPVPHKLPLPGVKDIVLGTAHACALLDDESVTCWGRIYFGRKENLLVPTAVPGVAKVKRLFAVGTASCATIEDHSLVCWGDIDAKGRLKLSGGSMNRVPTPSNVLDHVVAITANGALTEDGTVWFWGADGEPMKTALVNVFEIAATGDEVCGLRRDGNVGCAGPATRCAAAVPKAVAPAPNQAAPKQPVPKKTAKRPPAKKPVAKKPVAKKPAAKKPAAKKPTRPKPIERLLAVEVLRLPAAKHLAFDVGLCVVTTGGRLQCLAPRDGCELEAAWPGLANVDYVTGNCARLGDGNTRCWSVETKSRAVTAVAGARGTISVAASSSHACAILGDGSVVCWGSNKSGALGRGKGDVQNDSQASPVTF